MTTATVIDCPHCARPLYSTTKVTATALTQVFGAKIESDGDGTFMICSHCAARVAFERDHGTMVVGGEQPRGPER